MESGTGCGGFQRSLCPFFAAPEMFSAVAAAREPL